SAVELKYPGPVPANLNQIIPDIQRPSRDCVGAIAGGIVAKVKGRSERVRSAGLGEVGRALIADVLEAGRELAVPAQIVCPVAGGIVAEVKGRADRVCPPGLGEGADAS
ncbi:hypothetical protein LCGC14_2916190, partial [marine sediment metagenome]